MSEVLSRMPLWHTFFSFSGRINRRRFFFSNLVVSFLLVVAAGVTEYLIKYGAARFAGQTGVVLALQVAVFAAIGVLILASLALAAKRLHDMGHSALHLIWIYLLFAAAEVLRGFLPLPAMLLGLVAAAAQLALYIARGEDGPNAHGLPRIPSRAA